jgi:membrane-bound ClpP family serine protease
MDWHALLIASGLLLLAAGMLVAEAFVISFGMLTLISVGLGIAAVVYAFSASTALGWGFALVAPTLLGAVGLWAIRMMRRSQLVPKFELTEDAGAHHLAETIGLLAGASGVLLTPARPTGRARFAGGDLDVQCDRSAETGAAVTVVRIDGLRILVTVAEPSLSSPSTP